ncbi:RHS repeat-associated core domain-containing protein, partial [Pseudomonas sp. NY15356]
DNQLGKVTPVSRVDGDDDSERYHYADGGTRTRKVHKVQVSAATQTTITTYAGGCEIRQRWLAGQDAPQKHIVISEGGDVRVVEDRLAGTVRLRYRFADHLGSVGGETDAQGLVLAREEYAPYGGTVGCDEAAEEASNLTQRTMRYSNKERDATGLYYYGWRYYQAELGRWLSADPGGLIDGINLYGFSRNNPVNLIDTDGRGCISSKAQRIQEQRDRAAEQEEIEQYYNEVTQTIASEMAERMTAMPSTVGEGWSHQWKPGHSEASFKADVIQQLVGAGETPEQAELLQRRGFALGRREAQDRAASKALLSKASRSTSRHPEPSRSTDGSNAITIAWAHDYENIQKGGSETLYTGDVKDRLKEMNTDPNVTRDRDKWKNTEAGKRILAKVDSLAGKTYTQLSEELNNWVKDNSSMNEGLLYRGVDAAEYARWIGAGEDGMYNPGRFMASSKAEEQAKRFVNGGGMIHIEQGRGANIPNWFGNNDEQEVLFRREAKFKILSIDRSKKIIKVTHVR